MEDDLIAAMAHLDSTHVPAGACLAIFDMDNRLLLERDESTGLWGLPCSVVQPGESLEDAAIRYIQNTTGFVIDGLSLFGAYSGKNHCFPDADGEPRQRVTVAYIAKKYTGILLDGTTASTRYQFFDLYELPDPFHTTKPFRPIIDEIAKSYRRYRPSRTTTWYSPLGFEPL